MTPYFLSKNFYSQTSREDDVVTSCLHEDAKVTGWEEVVVDRCLVVRGSRRAWDVLLAAVQ